MTNQELKEMAILEMKRAIESAYIALDEKFDKLEICDKMVIAEQEREKAFEYLHKMEKAFEKRYCK